MTLKHINILLLTIVASGLIACSATPTRLTQKMEIGEKKGDAQPLMDEAAKLWKERGERSKADAAIAKWEEAAKVDPTRADVQLKLAYAYYFLVNVHIQWNEESKDQQSATFKKGIEAGELAIFLQNPEFKQKLESGSKWSDAVNVVPKEKINSLYWYATNLGKWSLLQGITTTLGNKDRIKSTMEHVLSLDETFFYGAPHRYFGVYEAKIPAGSVKKSGEHFRKAIEISKEYLDTQVLYAQYYAGKMQDEELFEKVLNDVLKADVKAIPELEIENRNAQRMAKKLLDNKDDIF